MTDAEFAARYPRLHHMADDGSWPSIRAHGLLSAVALCELYGVAESRRATLLTARRPQAVHLAAPALPGAVLRDQSPMTDGKLRVCLEDGLSPAQWYAVLNARVFFWLDRARLTRLLGARAYRRRAHLVITLDTGSLLAAHSARVRLSPINSGSTLFVPQMRGLATFRCIGDHPASAPAIELTVEDGVPDVAAHVVRLERWSDGEAETVAA